MMFDIDVKQEIEEFKGLLQEQNKLLEGVQSDTSIPEETAEGEKVIEINSLGESEIQEIELQLQEITTQQQEIQKILVEGAWAVVLAVVITGALKILWSNLTKW